jgi:hypothetical protein
MDDSSINKPLVCCSDEHICTNPTDASAEQMNRGCFCVSLDLETLRRELEAGLNSDSISNLLWERCPHIFSALPVFVSSRQVAAMTAVVEAVEKVAHTRLFQETALRNSPAIALQNPGAQGVFFGYDFHVTSEGVKLIEINTNAGGALLNLFLAKAQSACCPPVRDAAVEKVESEAIERTFFDMFMHEWKLANRHSELQTIAIVDSHPADQFLYPEFLLFQRLFQKYGVDAVIADPQELLIENERLSYGGKKIDLVYNRLTDFYFDSPESAALKEAYANGWAVVTPHPRAHALYANKQNLALFGDVDFLKKTGVPADAIDVLANSIPKTELVTLENADRLWGQRRKLFFKPVSGFGSKAAYRGDKLTKRVWEEMLTQQYVAQELILPSIRNTGKEDDAPTLKTDLRCYAYQGAVQLCAARLYQGQTTNFRTAGGGFAPVFPFTEKRTI